MRNKLITELVQQSLKVFQSESSLLGGNETKNAISKITPILNKIKPSDVGIYENDYGSNYNCIVSQRVFICNNFSMDIFIIPKSFSMPIHDHPNMTVCTKMLYGNAHFVAYDWENKNNEYNKQGKVKLSLNSVLSTDDDIQILSPSKNNLHCIKGNTTCAFFDILIPPYDNIERTCTYYKPINEKDDYIFDFNNIQDELNLISYNADNFICAGDTYKGPRPL